MTVFNICDHVSAASLYVEFSVGDFVGPEYTADLPQTAIVERADFAHVALGYSPTLSPIQ